MIRCPSCGFAAPDDFAFCPKCATRLTPAAAASEQRKLVTTLICDLVGFTAVSELADPEDIDRLLRDYWERARTAVELHGGTLEKFIGDAVVAVFGVPTVHEDDPERAVRAGLRLIDSLEDMTWPGGSPLQSRIGVNTGEALVRIDVDPRSGEGFLTGDAVNVAARLQGAAPPMSVVVGETTHALTERLFEYVELPRVNAKGKKAPLLLWKATTAVARRGVEARSEELTPLVGREIELAYLCAMADKASVQATPQFALLTGEPGIGKSRLVRELFTTIDLRPEMVTWRQGYCQPFGEGVTYGALAEIVKGHAGIRDTDPATTVEEKLAAVLGDEADQEWLRQRLRSLVGLPAPEASRLENFAAWLRLFEDMAASHPVVLVFEDLHWADDALLEFLEHMTTNLASVPLLVLGTARPELFERRPAFASSSIVNRIRLEPLSSRETEQLVVNLLKEEGKRKAVVGQIIERSGGNPFYAEQSVRLLSDRVQVVQLPGSVQAIIAARLDALPAQLKALLVDASVVGNAFWDGAVAAIGGLEREQATVVLSGLLERQLIRRLRQSTMEGEREFVFAHALAREVAYAELPRAARALKHMAFGDWLQEKAGEHLGDLTDVLAHHYATALELSKAAGVEGLAASLVEPVVRTSSLAGARAMDFDIQLAERHLQRALDLVSADDPRYPELLTRWGIVVEQAGRHRDSVPALETAIARLVLSGERRLAAKGSIYLAQGLQAMGHDALPRYHDAVRLVEGDEPSREMVFALFKVATAESNRGRPQRAKELAELALASGHQLHLSASSGDADYGGALRARGLARLQLGDEGGLDDMRAASEPALKCGCGLTSVGNYGLATVMVKGPIEGVSICQQAIELYHERGLGSLEAWMRGGLAEVQCMGGLWDEALSTAGEVMRSLEDAGDIFALMSMMAALAMVHAKRGETEEAVRLVEASLERARAIGGSTLCTSLIAAASAYSTLDEKRAARYLDELPPILDATFAFFGVFEIPQMLRLADLLGDEQLLQRFTSWIEYGLSSQQCARTYGEALLASRNGRHSTAAEAFAAATAAWHGLGVPYEEAQGLLGQGRSLMELLRPAEALPMLRRSREILQKLRAAPALAEVHWLLEGAAANTQGAD